MRNKLSLGIFLLSISILWVSATIDTTNLAQQLSDALPEATIPRNKDLFSMIDSINQLLQEQKQNDQIDDRTRKLIATLQKVVDSSKRFIKDKNQDEAVQKFIEHAGRITAKAAEEAKSKTGQLADDLNQFSLLIPKLQNFVSEAITSSEFRATMWATVRAFSDLFSRVASKTSQQVNKVQKTAENVKGDIHRVVQDAVKGLDSFKEDAKQAAQNVADDTSADVENVKDHVKKAVETDGENADNAKRAAERTTEKGVESAKQAAQDLKQSAEKNSQDAQDSFQQATQSAAALKDEIAQAAKVGINTAAVEGRKLFLQRIQPILYQLSRKRSYQQAASELQDLFDYFRNLKDNEVTSISPELQREFSSLGDEGLELISRFTNGKNLKRTKVAFWKLYNDLSLDQETRAYFSDLSTLTRDIERNPTKYQDWSKVSNTFSDLYDRGTTIVQSKYGDRFAEFFSELSDIFDNLTRETISQPVRDSLRLAADIATASPLHALTQLRHLATPYLKNFTKEIKLPPIEGKDDSTYYKVDNIIFHVDESEVEDILLHVNVGLKDKTVVELKVTDLDLTFKDVHFKYEKQLIQDEGVMDAHVKFPSWIFRWSIDDSSSLFGDSTVDIQLDTLDITIHEAHHKILDKVVLGLFSSFIKEKVRSSIENAFQEPAKTLGQAFNDYFQNKKDSLTEQIWGETQTSWSDSVLPQFFQTAN